MAKASWLSLIFAFVFGLLVQVQAADRSIVYIPAEAPFSDVSIIRESVMQECNLPPKLVDFIQKATDGDGTIRLVKDDEAVKAGIGRALYVEIANAISKRYAFGRHYKQVIVNGRLVENGGEIGSFTGKRHSRNPSWGSLQNSCSVLDHCMEALGKDIARWLKKPEMNSRIGD